MCFKVRKSGEKNHWHILTKVSQNQFQNSRSNLSGKQLPGKKFELRKECILKFKKRERRSLKTLFRRRPSKKFRVLKQSSVCKTSLGKQHQISNMINRKEDFSISFMKEISKKFQWS